MQSLARTSRSAGRRSRIGNQTDRPRRVWTGRGLLFSGGGCVVEPRYGAARPELAPSDPKRLRQKPRFNPPFDRANGHSMPLGQRVRAVQLGGWTLGGFLDLL